MTYFCHYVTFCHVVNTLDEALDHNPDGLRILELLESNGYRVCYHERDFLAGAPIMDNMIQSIKRSKRTVCLLSTNFLQRCVSFPFSYSSHACLMYLIVTLSYARARLSYNLKSPKWYKTEL